MIPQSYPLYARLWIGNPPEVVMTIAIIGWKPDTSPDAHGGYTPIIANMPHNDPDTPAIYGLPATGAHPLEGSAWRWRLTTDPNDPWKPTLGDGLSEPRTHKAASQNGEGR